MDRIWMQWAGKAGAATIGVGVLTALMVPPTTPRAAAPSPLAALAATAPDPALIVPSGPQIAIAAPLPAAAPSQPGPIYTPDAGEVTPPVQDLTPIEDDGEAADVVTETTPAETLPLRQAEAADPAPPIVVPPPFPAAPVNRTGGYAAAAAPDAIRDAQN